jgi:hypothetical protein
MSRVNELQIVEGLDQAVDQPLLSASPYLGEDQRLQVGQGAFDRASIKSQGLLCWGAFALRSLQAKVVGRAHTRSRKVDEALTP